MPLFPVSQSARRDLLLSGAAMRLVLALGVSGLLWLGLWLVAG